MTAFTLVTGGCGFIGSHIVVELVELGYPVLIVDNFCNSPEDSIQNINNVVKGNIECLEGDVRDKDFLRKVFTNYDIASVIHLAGLKSVNDSFTKPLEYYDNNIQGTLNLLKQMQIFNVKNFIFSSSATVYGDSCPLPYQETAILEAPCNPYGYSKYCVERFLSDLSASDPDWSIVNFRYFNPVGAHSSGLIGEYPHLGSTNLMPHILKAAAGQGTVEIFGGDFQTHDGTPIRDFIHVSDLAKGHCSGLRFGYENKGFFTFNLGTGLGYSVLEMVEAFKKATGLELKYHLVSRRKGDLAISYADASLARQQLKWEAKCSLADMCADSWKFFKKYDGLR